ncbi:MocR-like pyridoxine biosynthesis transcription factor PdxR [Pedobacter gandavensis]|uniref:Aminotransferase class I/II-fold pyridoxal phosphate-dependent enzyme n=1 Tax=Pedobacter gandavensis TaxID=2679963 RepID=A0ABR6ESN0_9SPHI|nr:PLP-dependent aminotransferase family protein [Pedobacter gandavensis]MBB2148266.1 aminotransferase class I/II-fold pyridoxal phosphate-dependent enzyme [Pedobacter gandavensis]
MSKISPEILLTFINLDRSLKTPLYIQLYDAIKQNVFDGMLKHGDRMPSTRSLATEFSISRNCVLLAFEQLTLEGFLTSKTGDGTYVCEQVNELKPSVRELKKRSAVEERTLIATETAEVPLHAKFVLNYIGQEAMLPFQPSIPSLPDFPFQIWAKIAANVYRNIHKLHLGYDSAQGFLPLREALTDYLRINRSISCTADQIVLVNGSSQAMHLIAELLLKKEDQCWMEDPGFLRAKSAFARFGAKICPVPIAASGMDLDYARKHFPAAKLAYVTPSHQYPLGETMPLMERIKLLKWAAQQNMWVIEDDYESEFRYVNRPIPALKGLDTFGKVIYVGTFNKTLFPALRIGYMVLPSVALAQQFTIAKAVIDRQSPVIDQAILTEFILEGHFSRHLRRMRLVYRKAQEDLVALLKQHLGDFLRVETTDAGMHLVAWLLDDEDATAVANKARANGVFIYAVDELSVAFKHPAALIIGFTGFSLKMMEEAVLKLKEILKMSC